MVDIAYIGAGPAGAAAALNVRLRNRSFMLFAARPFSDKLASAKEISNYPGLPGISGIELCESFSSQLTSEGIEVTPKAIDHVYQMGDYFALTCGDEMWEARSVILATGVSASKPLENEIEMLGSGVSYCATCDGRLYKGGHVLAVSYDAQAEEEVRYLCEFSRVTYLPCFKGASEIEGAEYVPGVRPKGLRRQGRQIALITDTDEYFADCCFIFRSAIAPIALIAGLETDGGHAVVGRDFQTNIKGVFAAGDLTGTPYQVAKAIGEGATAELNAEKNVSTNS